MNDMRYCRSRLAGQEDPQVPDGEIALDKIKTNAVQIKCVVWYIGKACLITILG